MPYDGYYTPQLHPTTYFNTHNPSPLTVYSRLWLTRTTINCLPIWKWSLVYTTSAQCAVIHATYKYKYHNVVLQWQEMVTHTDVCHKLLLKGVAPYTYKAFKVRSRRFYSRCRRSCFVRRLRKKRYLHLKDCIKPHRHLMVIRLVRYNILVKVIVNLTDQSKNTVETYFIINSLLCLHVHVHAAVGHSIINIWDTYR